MGKSSSIGHNEASVRIDDWARLKPAQRIDLCRRSADEALKFASETRCNMKEEYQRLAANWMHLAEEIEKTRDYASNLDLKRSA
jgi:hypothetical protein